MKSRLFSGILIVILLSAVLPMTATAALTKLSASDGAVGDYFGSSVALSDTYAVIGAPSASSGIGAIYIFDRTSAWAQTAKKTSDSGQSGDLFGNAVAISGNYIVVGAPYFSSRASHEGAAYIYKLSGTIWTLQSKIMADDKLTSSENYKYQDDRFGSSVAVSGNYIVVGAPYDAEKGLNSGSVYVFQTSGAQIAKLTASDAVAGDFFGSSVGVYGDYIFVGAPGRDDNAKSASGTVYVFKYNTTSAKWEQNSKFTASDSAAGDLFGTSLSMFENYAIVGAPGKSSNKGAAYIFELSGTTWTQKPSMTASDGAADDYFGISVSISGTTAIVGADQKDGTPIINTGAAYIYTLSGTTWNFKQKLTDTSPANNGFFGGSVATSGDYVLIGAEGKNSNKGEAYTDTAGTITNYTPTISPIADQYTNSFTPTTITFTVSDEENGTLTVSAVSDNSTVLPSSNIKLNNTSNSVSVTLSNKTATVSLSMTPVSNQYGKANITVTAKDSSGKQSSRSFMLNVSRLSSVDAISNQTVDEDSGTLTIPITVRDADGDSLTVQVVSDNNAVIATSAIRINGSALPYFANLGGATSAALSMTLPLIADANGVANITVTASDGATSPTPTSFKVTVNAVNDTPTMSAISNQTTNEDVAIGPINVTFADPDGGSLTVTATSTNTALIPLANILLNGQSSPMTVSLNNGTATLPLTIKPLADANNDLSGGPATITLTVKDSNGASASRTFTVNVTAVADKPQLGDIDNVTMNENGPPKTIETSVRHGDNLPVTITIASSNPTVAPTTAFKVNGSSFPYIPTLVNKSAQLSIVYTPPQNVYGTAIITVTATDSKNNTDIKTFTLNVLWTNTLPTISPDIIPTQTTKEDTATSPLTITISDAETAVSSLAVTGKSSDQTLVPDNNIVISGTTGSRSVVITPAANKYGTARITLTVTDTDGGSTSKSFDLIVTSVNDAPMLTGLPTSVVTFDEDTTSPIIPFTVWDPDGTTALSVTAQADDSTLIPKDNTHISIGGVGTLWSALVTDPQSPGITLTPAQDKNGPTRVVVSVSDGTDTTTGFFYVIVNPVNDPPTIGDINNQTTDSDKAVTVAYTVADIDTALSNLTVTASSSDKTLVPDANIVSAGTGSSRTLTITPAPGKFGTTTITLTVNDGAGGTVSKSFLLTVNWVNHAPTLTGLPTSIVTTNEDTASAPISFTIGDVDANSMLTVTVSPKTTALLPNDSSHINIEGYGNVYVTSISSTTKTVNMILTPAANQYGTTQLDVTVSDGTASSTKSMYLMVNPVNDAPTVTGLSSNYTMAENGTTAVTFTVDDIDTAITALTVTANSSNTQLVPNSAVNLIISGTGSSKTLTVTPALNANSDIYGTATITVTVSDGSFSAQAAFILTVTPVNTPPSISGLQKTYTMDEDSSLSVQLTLSDADTPTGDISVTAVSSNTKLVSNDYLSLNVQMVSGSSDKRTVNITPVANAFSLQDGTSNITITANDNAGGTATFVFTLIVNPVNDPPSVSGLPDTYTLDQTATGTITFTVADIDTAISALTVSATSDNTTLIPTVSVSGTGTSRTLSIKPSATATPTPGNNIAVVKVTVSDGDKSQTYSVPVTVNYVNRAPTIIGLPANYSMAEDSSVSLNFTVADTETAADSLTVTVTSSNTKLVPTDYANLHITPGTGGNRTLVIKPAQDAFTAQVGTSNIVVTVDDNSGTATATSKASMILTVTPVNDAPTISNFQTSYTMKEDSTATISFTVADVDSSTDAITGTVSSSNQVLVPNANLSFTGSGNIRMLTIKPSADRSGTAEITVIISDNDTTDPKTTTYKMMLTVEPQGDAPTISELPLQLKTFEDTAISTTFKVKDAEGGTLTITAVSSNTTLLPANSENIKIGGFGTTYMLSTVEDTEYPLSIMLIPAKDQSGFATVSITAKDEQNNSTTSSFFIQVEPVNDPPTIIGLPSQSAVSDGVASTAVNFTVSDPEGGVLIITAASSTPGLIPDDAEHIRLINTGSSFGKSFTTSSLTAGAAVTMGLSITPLSGVSGDATIVITAKDSSNAETTQSTVFRISMSPKAPVISGLSLQLTTFEDTTLNTTFRIKDAEGGAITITATSGTAAVIPSDSTGIKIENLGTSYIKTTTAGQEYTLNLSLIPAANANGFTTITLTAKDEQNNTSTASFVVQVDPVNDPPAITGLATQIAATDGTATTATTFTVSDIEGGVLIVTAESSSTALIPNDAAHINLISSGSGFGTSFTTASLAAGAAASIGLSVTPLANVSGDATITLRVKDSSNAETLKTLLVKISMSAKAPTISGLPLQLTTDEDVSVNTSFKIKDIEGGTLTITASSSDTALVPADSSHIQIANFGPSYMLSSAAGQEYSLNLTITPAKNLSGFTTITLTAKDPQGNSSKAEFFVQVNSVNDAPEIVGLPTQASATDGTATSPISFAVSDPEGGVLTITADSLTPGLVPNDNAHVNLTYLNGNMGKSFTTASLSAGAAANIGLILTPLPNVSGDAMISVKATDSLNASNTQTFVLKVSMGLKPPIIAGFSTEYTTNEDTRIDIPFTLKDNEGGFVTVSVSSSDMGLVPVDDQHINIGAFAPTNYVLNAKAGVTNNLTLKITPAANKFGITVITVSAKDDTNATSQSSFILQVTPVPDPPSISGLLPLSTDQDKAVTTTFTASDPEGGNITIAVSSSNQTLLPNANIQVNSGTNTAIIAATAGVAATVSLKLSPASGVSGTATITVTARDEDNLSTSSSFLLTVIQGKQSPVISNYLANVPMYKNSSSTIAFTVSDTQGGIITVTATSSNTALIPIDSTHINIGNAGISYAKSIAAGGSFTESLKITPVTGQYGSAVITLKATDSDGLIGTASIAVQVSNQLPPGTLAGDIDGNGFVDLADAIVVLRILNNISVSYVNQNADVNGDGKIGIEELIYILQKVAGLR